MHDQAQSLRERLKSINENAGQLRTTRVIAVTSGKGGVGKSNFTLNFALTLQAKGYKVLVFDADIGLANLDLLMGVRPTYNLYHLLKREKTLEQIVYTGAGGLQLIAGGSGFQELFRLNEEDLDYFSSEISRLNGQFDFVIFDTGAGIAKETMKFILAADETVVVTTPEPTAITDAYAVLKMVSHFRKDVHFLLVVNRVSDRHEGMQTAEKLCLTAHRFLNLEVNTLGFVPDDPSVPQAVKKQTPFTVRSPHCAASKGIQQVCSEFLYRNNMEAERPTNGVKGFVSRMIRLLNRTPQ